MGLWGKEEEDVKSETLKTQEETLRTWEEKLRCYITYRCHEIGLLD